MIHKFFTFVTISFFLLGVVACTATPAATPAATPLPAPTSISKTIVLGGVSEDSATITKAYQPLADYLAAHLSQYGVTAGAVKIAPDQPTMVTMLTNGTVDVYFDSPYGAMIANDKADAQIILRRWKGGVDQYKSLIMVRKDSGIKSLADLKGHVVAFDAPFSTTSFMLPLAYMIQGGLQPVKVTSADSVVPQDKVGYVFAQGQSNVTDWLASGKVAAGAFSDQDLKDVPANVMDEIVPLVETENLPRYLTLVRPGMEQAEVNDIKGLLLGIDQTPEGPAILKTFEKTAKFDELPNKDAMLARLRQLYQAVKDY